MWARLAAPMLGVAAGVALTAGDARQRLDAEAPGEWDLTWDPMPHPPQAFDEDERTVAVKARLQIMGVIREAPGEGRGYVAAVDDAFVRAAGLFGIGKGDAVLDEAVRALDMASHPEYAEPVRATISQPGTKEHAQEQHAAERADTRRAEQTRGAAADLQRRVEQETGETASTDDGDPPCPKCEGRMWDNRATKRNPKAPNFKCRDRSCDGVIWPERQGNGAAGAGSSAAGGAATPAAATARGSRTKAIETDDDEIPF